MKKLLIFVVVAVTLLIITACGAKSSTEKEETQINATQTPWVVTSTTVQQPTAASTATPTIEATPAWTQVQVGKYSEGVEVDGKIWELVLGTHLAATTKNGRYEAVESALVGVHGNKDYGWCGEKQLDCPPHALLVMVEVPAQNISCMTAGMDISWRIQLKNECDTEVPIRVSVRYNDVTRSQSELAADYLSLAGLTQKVQNANSEVGLFVSVRENGTSELHYGSVEVPFGYSCWDCLADTMGVSEPRPVQLVANNISNFGPDTTPLGNALLSGVVFPLPRPTQEEDFELSFELEATPNTPLVVWAGRYDAQPATPTPTPAP